MKSIILMATVVLFSTAICHAQINNAKTETIKVYGNCEMCESTIEKAANENKVSKADWNESTKMATITYDSKKTNVDAVLKNIALAGYDNEKFLAPDETYNKLPGCCKYEREKKAAATTDHNEMDMGHDGHTAMNKAGSAANQTDAHSGHDMQMQSTGKQDVNQLQSVFEDYFLLKDALVKTDGAEASAKAATLLTAINAVKMETLKADEHTIWMKVKEDLKLDAEHIAATKDASLQRNYFTTLSENMYTLIKAAKPDTTIYYQNCPMFNDGKGANWLSKESAVKNPYYGSAMLTCGKTVETIK